MCMLAKQAVYQHMASDVASWWAEDAGEAEALMSMPLLMPAACMMNTHAAATSLAAAMA